MLLLVTFMATEPHIIADEEPRGHQPGKDTITLHGKIGQGG